MDIGLVVPVLKNFQGFAELMASVDQPVLPCVIPNWARNQGVPAAWNVGLTRAAAYGMDYALVCNDDIVLQEETIQKLVDAVNVGFDLVSAINTRNNEVDDRPHYPETPDFSCFMVKPQEFLKKFGRFDEDFFPAYFEDNDMAYRIKLADGIAVCRTDAGMYHRGSVTQNWDNRPVVTAAMFEQNKAHYVHKWGGMPGKEKFRTPFNN